MKALIRIIMVLAFVIAALLFIERLIRQCERLRYVSHATAIYPD